MGGSGSFSVADESLSDGVFKIFERIYKLPDNIISAPGFRGIDRKIISPGN